MTTIYYTDFLAEPKNSHQLSSDPTPHLSEVLQFAPTIRSSQTCRETIRVMFSYPDSPCIVVCDKNEQPIGLVMCERFYLRICSRIGRDSFYNDPISKLMSHHFLSADINDSFAKIATAANNRPSGMRIDCVILTNNGRFTGIVQASDLNRKL